MAASYNADIRIGIVGKTQLNSLEKQLNRVNTAVKTLNKNLVLKTRAQTIKLNTKGANTAIKQLEDRINKLGRTITINVKTNEKKGSSSSGGGGGGVGDSGLLVAAATPVVAEQIKKNQQIARKAYQERITQLEDEAKGVDKVVKAYAEVETNKVKLLRAQDKVNEKQEKITELTNRMNAANREAARINGMLTKGRIKDPAKIKANTQELARQKVLARDYAAQIGNANKGQGNLNKLLEDQVRLQERANKLEKEYSDTIEKTARNQIRRKSTVKGALTGAGIAGASALGNIPVLGDAVTGGLAAGLSGASIAAGAAGAAIVGLIAVSAQYANQAAVAAAETQKFQQALRGVTFGADYEKALESVNRLSEQFQEGLGETTQQFTKLTAAASANGLTVAETEEIYKGLAAANLALGGDAEKLQSILLATGQVLSKGKVQAEELTGQIGEKLPGAFSLFAKAIGKTPKELSKALQKGEVTIDDFVQFTRKLFDQFGENAEEIVNGPALAGQRLEKALGDLQRNTGTLLAPIGAAFQDTFTQIINIINGAITALTNFLGIGLEGSINKAANTINAETKRIDRLEKTIASGTKGRGNNQNKFKSDLAASKGRLKAAQAEIQALQAQRRLEMTGTAASKPTRPPTVDDPAGGTAGGSSSRGRRPRINTTDQLEADLLLQQNLNKLAKSRIGIYDEELAELDLINREIQAQLERERDLISIKAEELYADERRTKELIAQAEYEGKILGIKEDAASLDRSRNKQKDDALRPLNDQKAILEAKLISPEKEKQVRLEIEARDIAEAAYLLEADTVLEILKGNAALQDRLDIVERQRLQMEQLKGQIYQTLGRAVEDVLVDGIAAAVSEAEKLSDVLTDIGRQLLSTVGRILINSAIRSAAGPGGLFGAGGLPGFAAKGGPVMPGQPYVVGENGPEMVIPSAPGMVIPNDVFAATKQIVNRQMSNGEEGGGADEGSAFAIARNSVLNTTNNTRTQNTMTEFMQREEELINNPAPIKVDYQSTVINSQTYVTEEQFQKGMSRTANQARQATIRDLRNKPASRKMAGVNR